jgi:hypothetical protein
MSMRKIQSPLGENLLLDLDEFTVRPMDRAMNNVRQKNLAANRDNPQKRDLSGSGERRRVEPDSAGRTRRYLCWFRAARALPSAESMPDTATRARRVRIRPCRANCRAEALEALGV